MKVVVFYATREGHTRHIAEHIADDLPGRKIDVDVYLLLADATCRAARAVVVRRRNSGA